MHPNIRSLASKSLNLQRFSYPGSQQTGNNFGLRRHSRTPAMLICAQAGQVQLIAAVGDPLTGAQCHHRVNTKLRRSLGLWAIQTVPTVAVRIKLR